MSKLSRSFCNARRSVQLITSIKKLINVFSAASLITFSAKANSTELTKYESVVVAQATGYCLYNTGRHTFEKSYDIAERLVAVSGVKFQEYKSSVKKESFWDDIQKTIKSAGGCAEFFKLTGYDEYMERKILNLKWK